MDDLIESINTALDVENFNYKTFSKTDVYFIAGMHHLRTKYNKIALFSRNIITYDYTIKNLIFENILLESFKRSNKAYMIVGLYLYSKTFQHANVLIFSKTKSKIDCTRYDPQYSCCIYQDIHDEIDNILRSKFKQLDVKYISPSDMSVIVCPQSYAVDFFGYCQTYTIIYIDNFLKNSGKNMLKIINIFPSEQELNNRIKLIVTWILDQIKQDDRIFLLNFDILNFENRVAFLNMLKLTF
jgi:hypothetical protein